MNKRELEILELLIIITKELHEQAESDDRFIYYGGWIFLNLFRKLVST